MTPRQARRRRSPLDGLIDPELFKAFSDPTRASLLTCLAKCRRACTVGEIAECCAVDMSVVSRHLATLARAGVVHATRQGRTVSYEVRYDELCRKLRSIADAIEACCPDGRPRCCG